ncbi:hypothetical protein [Gilvimarinus xylanilyticus]|uniref:Lysozyme inhibitor LprI N-terminal domain-containing protein n=1 Tax=Gilvimarinus xylanilyticus TaxID=2944139 RepID=A0A9X2HY27_9GAMM|nr:hypothetical protein [Gilvimarinus xylanilyticus]MCP8899184.1 hypothetical protein [Gilvimarinus xylanilyticus]
MRILTIPLALAALAFFAAPIYACDEDCKKANAEQEHGVKFASYLNQDFCRSTRADFLIQDYKSLAKYRADQLPGGHKGGMNNIRKMLDQRVDWLRECDDYLRLTDQGRIFRDRDTTDKIFKAMKGVSEELNNLVYNGSQDVIVTNGLDIAEQDFDQMLQLLDQHRTQMQLRGQLVNL